MGKRLIGSVGLKPGTDTGFDLDEKGQIHGYSDQQFALPVGDDNQILSSLASEASGLKWITQTSAWVGTATSNLDMDTYNIFDIDFLQLSAPTELTIATGAVTFSQSYHSIDTEADASSDNLDSFDGLTTGQFLILKSVDNSRDVVLRSGLTGDKKMNGVGNYTLADIDYRWTSLADTSVTNFTVYELSRSSNTA